MSGPEDPRPDGDWDSFRAARDRFLSKARPEAMDDPPPCVCPDALPEGWASRADGPGPDEDRPPAVR